MKILLSSNWIWQESWRRQPRLDCDPLSSHMWTGDTHHCPVSLHAAQVCVSILSVDGEDDAVSCLVPVMATRHLFLVLHTNNLSAAVYRDWTPPVGQMWDRCWTFLVTQQCLPELQPFWSKKELKSIVLMQQQLQNLYLTERRVSLSPHLLSPPSHRPRVSLPHVEDGSTRMMLADLRVCVRTFINLQRGHEDTLLDWSNHVTSV